MSPTTAATVRLWSAGWLPEHDTLIPHLAAALKTSRTVRFRKLDGHAVIDFLD
jgi:hypothetical protein